MSTEGEKEQGRESQTAAHSQGQNQMSGFRRENEQFKTLTGHLKFSVEEPATISSSASAFLSVFEEGD